MSHSGLPRDCRRFVWSESVASSAVNVVMPAPGSCRSKFGSPLHLPIPPTRRSGSAGRADRTRKNRAVRRGQRHHSRTFWLVLAAAGFVAASHWERPVPEARPAFDAAVGTHPAEKHGDHAHDPGHMRRPVNISATTPGTNVTDCHLVPTLPCGENLTPNPQLARCDLVTARA